MLFLSSTAFERNILTPDGVPDVAGFPAVELSGGLPLTPAEIAMALERLRGHGVADILVHNYFPPPPTPFVLNFATADQTLLARCFVLADNALRLCSAVGAPYYSFHPGYRRDGRERPDGHFEFFGSPRSMADTLACFHDNFPALHRIAETYGIRLAVENLFPTRAEVTSLANTMEEMEALIAPLPGDVGLLLDLGHLAVSSTILGFDRHVYLQRLLAHYGDRLFEVHLSGNHGETDAHLPLVPGDWQLGVLPLFRGLPGADGDGVRITLESRRLPLGLLQETTQLITSHR